MRFGAEGGDLLRVTAEECSGVRVQMDKSGLVKRKTSKKLPPVSRSEVEALPKTEAVLVRMTSRDKEAIVAAASKLRLTVTEFVTKASLMVAEKV